MRPRPYRETTSLFCGLLFSDRAVLSEAVSGLQDIFGPYLLASEPFAWDFSGHYDAELGRPVLRSFLFFPPQFDPSLLPDAKLLAISLEERLSLNARRRVNIDPGFLALSKVVLASAKNYSHRIYLGKGIYGELTLRCVKDRFEAMPYTYHDYRDERTLSVLLQARSLLKLLSAPVMLEDDQVVPVYRLF